MILNLLVWGLSLTVVQSTGTTCGYGTGSIIVAASGGMAPYTYSYTYLGFTTTQSNGNFQNLLPGTYPISVTDANGLTASTTVTLNNTYPPPSVHATSLVYPSGCATFDGSITVQGSGGTPPYTYSMDNATWQTIPVFSGLSNGSYILYIKDANGCLAQNTIDASGFFNIRSATCYLEGAITTSSIYSCGNKGNIGLTTPFGGIVYTPPYEYSLDGGTYGTTMTFNGLGPGLHTIYIRDAKGLVTAESVVFQPYCTFDIEFIEVDASCGQSDGALTVTAAGGMPPYRYTIDGINYQTSNTFTGLSSGNYMVTVMDAAGNTYSQTGTVYNKCPVVTATGTDATCGVNNGTITATGSKGTPPYQFSIDGVNFQSGNNFSGLPAGNYTVTIRDVNGFTGTCKITIADNCILVALTITQSSCGLNNGSIMAIASNGTAPYQYSIDDVNFTAGGNFSNLAAGNYTVYVEDAAGMSTQAAASLVAIPAPVITPVLIPASCADTGGVIRIARTGGTAPFQYSINGGLQPTTDSVFTSLDSGQYILQVFDSNACSATDTIRLSALPTPQVFLGNDTSLCAGDTLVLTVGAGVGTTYLWPDNSSGKSFSVTTSGQYEVKASNSYGCQAADTIAVHFIALPRFQLGADTTICDGRTLFLKPVAAVTGNYLWNDASTGPTELITTPGVCWLQVTDSGCARRDSIAVSYKPSPIINLATDTSLCVGQRLLLDVTNPGSTYLWQDGSTGSQFLVDTTGKYWVQVAENGCDTTARVTVQYESPPLITLPRDTTLCITQQLVLDAASPNARYLWQDGSTGSTFTLTQPGTYFVTVTNACGAVTDTTKVDLSDCLCKWYIPNAFTPNGNGQNARFRPHYSCIFSEFSLSVYNRWGQLIYRTEDPADGWDGTLQGNTQPTGAYVWMLKYKDTITGKQMEQTGTVLLLR